MESYLKELNPQQLEAVLYNDGTLLVLAGAGSGKTKVLTYKYAYLIKNLKLEPNNILAVTFTNKAANEMKERIVKLTNINFNSNWISTFHSFGVKVLRRFITRLGYKENFVIYDDTDQQNFLKRLLKQELNLDEKIYHPKKVQAFINYCKNQGLFPTDIQIDENSPFNKNLQMIYLMYQDKMKENNSLDFGDLLILTYKLLKENEDILEYYNYLFKFILVDEYQDTNKIQYKLLKILSEKNRKICVVGDDDQSIYSWRGANIENILYIERDFPEIKIVKLEKNYRSTQIILEAANHIISKNSLRKQKKLWTDKKEGSKIKITKLNDEYEEATFVVSQIKKLGDFSNTAILYRTNAQSRVFEDELIKNNIPYIIIGGFKFFDRKEIKDIIAYLKIIDGSEDILNYKRIINTPPRRIGEKTFNKLVDFAEKNRLSIFEALEVQKETHSGLNTFYKLIKRFREKKLKESISKLAEDLYYESGYIDMLDSLDYIERENKIENLQELLNSIKNFEKNNPDGTLTEYLDSISLTSSVDVETKGEVLNLMTIHAAKGLEFKNVFLVGFENGLLPHANSVGSPKEFEEERRLCYVAITRAKENLFITYASQRQKGRFSEICIPSIFLKDIPAQLIDSIDKNRNIKKEKKINSSNQDEKFKTGTIINHKVFGIGKVTAIIGAGEDKKIVVYFKSHGVKTLALKYAPIQLI